MKKFRLALATCSKVPTLYEDDQSALPSLERAGIHGEPVIWDSGARWRDYDGVVIRSTWDYWLKHESFVAWISELESFGVRVFNPPKVIRENTRKTYLKRLQARNVPMLPTHWIEKGTSQTLQSILDELNWDEIVSKPSVSGGAYRTYRFRLNETASFEKNFREIIQDSEALIQPLAPTILSHGELSFLFFGGKFSHAAIKRGPEGEFRIQRSFGDTVAPYSARPEEIAQAEAALSVYCAPEDLLYARLDMIRDPGNPSQLLLMEVEATEPNLFFLHDNFNPGAAERFANAALRHLNGSLG